MRPPFLSAVILLSPVASAFYIPGWSIRNYEPSEPIPLLTNKIYSDSSQVQFAYDSLPFICPANIPANDPAIEQPPSVPGPHASHDHQHPAGLSSLLAGQPLALNLGQVLAGDRIVTSAMALYMSEDTPCAMLCSRVLSPAVVARARKLIAQGYLVEWIVDNLPGATKFVAGDGEKKKYYAAGFKLGTVDYRQSDWSGAGDDNEIRPRYHLNNHHTIVLLTRRADGQAGVGDQGARVVVGFEVYPTSIAPSQRRGDDGCPVDIEGVTTEGGDGFELVIPEGADNLTVPYTYSVRFREDETMEWRRRWDRYFVNQQEGASAHWLAIINSAVICAVLTSIVALILARTIRADLKSSHREQHAGLLLATVGNSRVDENGVGNYLKEGYEEGEDEEIEEEEEEEEEEGVEVLTGWKLLHADVFRPPEVARLLAPLVGSGIQLLLTGFGLVLLGAVGVLNPSFRGGVVSVGVGIFVFTGLFSGYFSARLFATLVAAKTAGKKDAPVGSSPSQARAPGWRVNALLTATLVPGLVSAMAFVLNLFVWAQASSTAVPFTTIVGLLWLWLGVQVPLVLVGSWIAIRRRDGGVFAHPARGVGAATRRPVPPLPWLARPRNQALMGGVVPFIVILIELLFALRSVWTNKSGFYYVPGFAAAVAVMVLVSVAEVSVVAVYIGLCAEDPRWWWRSFAVGAGGAVWVFGYCIWYFFFGLEVDGLVGGMWYLGYCFAACCAFGLLTGAVGFVSSYAFVTRLYGAIKMD